MNYNQSQEGTIISLAVAHPVHNENLPAARFYLDLNVESPGNCHGIAKTIFADAMFPLSIITEPGYVRSGFPSLSLWFIKNGYS